MISAGYAGDTDYKALLVSESHILGANLASRQILVYNFAENFKFFEPLNLKK